MDIRINVAEESALSRRFLRSRLPCLWVPSVNGYPNAAYDKELDTFEADAPGLKDLRKDMRAFLSGVGGQFALRGSRRDDSIWVRAWKGGREEGREEEATNNLLKCLEIRFNKSKKETEPLLNKTSLEDIEAYLGIAYACDDYDAFVRRAEEVKRRGRSS